MARINIYDEELTPDTELVEETNKKGTFYGFRIFLESAAALPSDAGSAVTFWFNSTEKREDFLLLDGSTTRWGRWWHRWHARKAVSARFVVPAHRHLETGELTMVATPLLDDVISTIPVEFDNAAGTAVDAPAGISYSIDNATAGSVAVNADGKSCDFTPAQPPDDTQVAKITMTDGTITTELDISLTADKTATRAHLVTTGITTRPLGT